MAMSSYELKGGSLRMVRYSGRTNLYFSFYIYDRKAKVAAYCYYATDLPVDVEKLMAEDERHKVFRHQIGVGGHASIFDKAKPIDLKSLDHAKCSLYLVKTQDSAERGTAIIDLVKGGVRLLFPILTDFSISYPTTTHGYLMDVRIATTSRPQFPKEYVGEI